MAGPTVFRRDGRPYRDPEPEEGSVEWNIMMQEVNAELRDKSTTLVEESTLPSGISVTTEWIAIGPEIFFTSVEGPTGYNLESIRSRSEAEARATHEKLLEKWAERDNADWLWMLARRFKREP